MRGTIAIDRPKLSAIRSITSIPRSVFFAGNKVKIKTYPGMNKRNGNPRSVRTVVSMESNAIGSNMILQRIQNRISRGYFDDETFMLSGYIPRMVIIFFPTMTMKMMTKR